MQRDSNEKVTALKEMIKAAGKHFPQIVPILRYELEGEYNRLHILNQRRLQLQITQNRVLIKKKS